MPLSVKSSSSWRKSEADRILTLANWNDATNFDSVYVHKIEGTYSISGTLNPAMYREYKLIELSKPAFFIPIYFSIKGTITIPYTSNTSGYNVSIDMLGSSVQYIAKRVPMFSSYISLGSESGDISIDICSSSECDYINAVNAVVNYFYSYFNVYITFVKHLVIRPFAYYNYPNYTVLDRIDVNMTGKLAAIAVTESDGLSITEYSTPTPYSSPGMAMSAPLAASAGVSSPVRGPPGWGNTLPSGRQKPSGAKP
jgi:hypothetical protein